MIEATAAPGIDTVLVATSIRATHTVGCRALLVDVADADCARGLAAWTRASGVEAEEIVPGAGSVLFDGCADLDALRRLLDQWPGEPDRAAGPPVDLPVTYDGADLAFAARRWGMTTAEAVATHAACVFVVAFCGFAPGFAYLEGLPAELALPRLASPRRAVPSGSVAVAGTWTGIYPTASPGGWRLLGRTEVRLWRPENAEAPALLAPGTRVRLVASS